jgi:hypothetical protein
VSSASALLAWIRYIRVFRCFAKTYFCMHFSFLYFLGFCPFIKETCVSLFCQFVVKEVHGQELRLLSLPGMEITCVSPFFPFGAPGLKRKEMHVDSVLQVWEKDVSPFVLVLQLLKKEMYINKITLAVSVL